MTIEQIPCENYFIFIPIFSHPSKLNSKIYAHFHQWIGFIMTMIYHETTVEYRKGCYTILKIKTHYNAIWYAFNWSWIESVFALTLVIYRAMFVTLFKVIGMVMVWIKWPTEYFWATTTTKIQQYDYDCTVTFRNHFFLIACDHFSWAHFTYAACLYLALRLKCIRGTICALSSLYDVIFFSLTVFFLPILYSLLSIYPDTVDWSFSIAFHLSALFFSLPLSRLVFLVCYFSLSSIHSSHPTLSIHWF